MASLDVIALDPVTPQLRAPGVGDTYHFCRVVEFQDGTDAAPSITNVGDANTGIYWPNADELAVSTGGVQRMSLGATTVFNETGADVDFRVEGDADANLLFVDASTDRVGLGLNNPDRLLDVDGSSKFRGQILITSGEPLTLGLQALQLPTGTESTIGAGLSTRTGVAGESIIQFGNNMNTYYTGSVNAAKPGAMIRIDTRGVEPTPGASAYSVFQIQTRAAGVADPNYTVPVQIGAAPQGTFCIQTNGLATFNYGFVVNEGGGDYDTRFEGDTDTHLFFADASTDRIGIGTASPAFKLDVAGTGKVSALYLTAMTAGSGALYYTSTRLTLANYNVNGIINFETNGGASAGSIDASQNWGIGTDTPNVRLDVNGAMRLRGSTSGYVGLQAAAVAGTTTYTLPSADGSNGQVLTTNGTGTLSWTTNAGGDVTGPASASDNAIARFDGTTGKLIQNSAVFVDDDGDVGIGTSTPGEKLQIESGTPRIYMNATTNSASAGMYFRVKDGSGNADNSGIFLEPTANIANRYINFSASNIGSDMAIRAGGNVGIGTISPATKLSITNDSAATNSAVDVLTLTQTSSGTAASGLGPGVKFMSERPDGIVLNRAGIYGVAGSAADDDGDMTFWTLTTTAPGGFTEKMRLDSSGNLGLGTTSPSTRLHAAIASGTAYTTSSTGNVLTLSNSTASGYAGIAFNTEPSAGNAGIAAINSFSPSSGNSVLTFSTRTSATLSEKLRLDESGNLGLGVTPSAGSVHFDVSNGGSFYGLGTGAQLAGNSAFSGGTWVYRGSGRAARIDINNGDSGGMSFNVASASGTAGNAITFTQAMTLTSGGELWLGTSSGPTDSNYRVVEIKGKAGLFGPQIKFNSGDGTNTGLLFLDVNGLCSGTDGAYPVRFYTNGTERARITSGGKTVIGPTSLANDNLFVVDNSSTTGYGISVSVNNNSSGTYRYFEGFSTSASAQRIAIYTNGDVKNTNGVFAAFSDVKLKKDIVDAGSQWDDIKALRVRKYKLKNDAEGAVQIGLIAQEVEQVSPGLVNESQDETRDEDGKIVLTGEVTKGVKYSILYMKAVKALQEAMARIESLEAKVAALEAK